MDEKRAIGRPAKIVPNVKEERTFWQQGFAAVAGLDEAGRGSWAGPVCAAAVVLIPSPTLTSDLSDVRDSKMLSAKQRARCFGRIISIARGVGIGFADEVEIDSQGIVAATRLAMKRALSNLEIEPQALIIDALTLPGLRLPQRAFPRADAQSLSVAAAGIVAKVTRDWWMSEVAENRFPGYGFAKHKGYGTRQHREALVRLGVSPLHRRSFRPVALCAATAGMTLPTT